MYMIGLCQVHEDVQILLMHEMAWLIVMLLGVGHYAVIRTGCA